MNLNYLLKKLHLKANPIRTIHHFACTGGSLISKCLAALPNTLLLSELDPLHPVISKHPEFSPSDIIKHLKTSTMAFDNSLFSKIFIESIKAVKKHCYSSDLNLILRDHTHSHYCVGNQLNNRQTFRKILSDTFSLRSIVTVRDPIDSYLSLVSNDWVHFNPPSFDEYCRRYHSFLDDYADVPIFKYEDFVKDSKFVMKQICKNFLLTYAPEFEELYTTIHVTGESGRRSEKICIRKRRDYDNKFLMDAINSVHYKTVAERLGYDVLDDTNEILI